MADGSIVTQIPDHIRAQFSDQWGIQIQQLDAKLAGVMTVEPGWTAKDYYFDDVEKIDWAEETGRHEDTNPTEVDLSKIRGTKRYLKVAKIFGRRDAEWLDRIGRPDSEVMTAMKAGFMRALDDRCVAAAAEQKYAGPENAQTLISFPAGNVVAQDFVLSGAAANSGLTVPKLFEVERLARVADVDFDSEEFYLAIGPKQIQDMVAHVTAAGNDIYAKMLADWLNNRSSKLLGIFNVIVSNKLEIVSGSNSYRRCLAFTRRAFAKSPETHTTAVDTLPGKSHSVQIAAYGDTGVVRRYDNLVYHMLCDETL
jgi:hypothetical protein